LRAAFLYQTPPSPTVSTVQRECTYASKYTAPTVTERHYVQTVRYIGAWLCSTYSTYGGHRACFNDTHSITQYSFVIIFCIEFLAHRLENAEKRFKFAFCPYGQCGCHCIGFHETQNFSAALRWHILCSVSPEFIRNMGTVDKNQFSSVSRVYVQSNSMSASQIFVKSFYTDLHDKPTDSLVPAIMGGWADVSYLRHSFLLNKS